MEGKDIKTYIDHLIDADGFKTDLTISIPRDNLLEIALYLTGAAAASSLIFFIIKSLFSI